MRCRSRTLSESVSLYFVHMVLLTTSTIKLKHEGHKKEKEVEFVEPTKNEGLKVPPPPPSRLSFSTNSEVTFLPSYNDSNFSPHLLQRGPNLPREKPFRGVQGSRHLFGILVVKVTHSSNTLGPDPYRGTTGCPWIRVTVSPGESPKPFQILTYWKRDSAPSRQGYY